MDSDDGYVEHVQVHPANQAEVSKLPEIVDQREQATGQRPQAVLADKGYASQANREYLNAKGIGELIQFKASRGHPIHPLQAQMTRPLAACALRSSRRLAR